MSGVKPKTMEDIDWNGMWKGLTQKASWSRRRRGSDMINFWNRRARRYNEVVKHNNRSMEMISKLDIDPSYTVLDIVVQDLAR